MKGEKKILEEESNARKADLGEDREMKIAPSCWQTGASKHNTNGRIKKNIKKAKCLTAQVSVGGGEIMPRNSKISTFLPESR